MPAFNFLDLPCSIFLYIISFVKDVRPLRLVCRSFNTYVCEVMFDTLVFQEGPCREPPERPHTQFVLGPVMPSINCLAHQLDTLYTNKQPVALRRAKTLKISVSPLFHYSEPLSAEPLDPSAVRKSLQATILNLRIKLPLIIRTLRNLREATICLSEFEPEEFTHEISSALLTLPHLSAVNVIFLDPHYCRSLPIVGSTRLETIKISWPLKGPDSLFFSIHKSSPIYSQIFGATTSNTSLKRLELRSADLLLPRTELYQLCALPCLEELVIDNVPVSLSEDDVKDMRELKSLRLAYGQPSCQDGEPCAGVWKGLREAGTRLTRLSVDMVGEAFLAYLRSYVGLETLELKFERHADQSYTQDLFERGLQHHEGSLKSLLVHVHLETSPLSALFFEYWKEWIPPFGNLERLEATTSLNLFYEFDAYVLVSHITDVVALIPTLRIVKISHPYSDYLLFPEEQQVTKVVREGVEPTRVPGGFTPPAQEDGCGFLKLI